MSDDCFYNELWIYCYLQQINGFQVGSQQRINFRPIVTVKYNEDGTINRSGTLEMPVYCLLSIDDRAALLA
jgi:outer membrane protein assembly factor BamE (lipoprotein component of BamABCDE complex)